MEEGVVLNSSGKDFQICLKMLTSKSPSFWLRIEAAHEGEPLQMTSQTGIYVKRCLLEPVSLTYLHGLSFHISDF